MRKFSVRGLGEVAIRCADIDAMTAFYRDVIGLPIMEDFRADGGIVFFNIGDVGSGFGGHTTILALFAHDAVVRDAHPKMEGPPQTGARSSLHHLALTVSPDEQERAKEWFDEKRVPYNIQDFGWIGWRGVFVHDPEGNTVELVAHNADWRTG